MKDRIVHPRPLSTDLAALLLRLIFGGLFVYHGYDKIEYYDLYLSMTKPIIGLEPKLAYNLIIFAEFVCGFFVAVGFLTRITVLPLMFSMGVAVFVAHANDNFQGKELAFLFWLLTFVVFVLGSGRFSIDALLFKRKSKG